jgi:hypothetical protein
MTEPWHNQCSRIAADDRLKVTGYIVSAWPIRTMISSKQGSCCSTSARRRSSRLFEDILPDHQPIAVKSNIWHAAMLEIINDEVLFRMGDHVAYARAERICVPRNLVSLTMGTTWHEIKRVRIWQA